MLAHETSGEGIPVVLIHAFPLSHAIWRNSISVLRGIGRVIAPDLPGFGGSPRQESPSIPQMAKEIATLLDHLKVKEPVVVAGLSMGGYVAFEFLRQFPKRVRGLGLFSTRAGIDTPEGRGGRLKSAQKIKAEGLKPFAGTILPRLLGKGTIESKPEVVQEVTRLILANDPSGVADALLAMANRRDSTDLLPAISCPTWVIAGEEDSFLPVSEAQGMQARIPGAHLEVIEKAGHLVNLEQPALFQQILEEFLERCRDV
jgi:pimeloyl-ACP methyl ester carboxylesterase